jgi:hypothetical protein
MPGIVTKRPPFPKYREGSEGVRQSYWASHETLHRKGFFVARPEGLIGAARFRLAEAPRNTSSPEPTP